MNIAKACIQHKVATILSVIMVIIFGVLFGTQLQMALMPEIELPMAMVMCVYPGATPSDIEELVTKPLEEAVMQVSGVDEIESTSSDSMAVIQITYVDGTDLDIAATKLREKFDLVDLPDDANDPIIVNMNMSELMPTVMIALMGDDLAELQTLADDVVSPALVRIEGVARAEVMGGMEQQIAVELDSARTAGFGLSNSYVSQFLAGQNLVYPGGDMDNGNKTLTVSTDAKFQSVEDVANTLISLPTGGTIRLGEVANVFLEDQDQAAIAKVGDTPCVILQVSKQSDSNEMEVAQAVEKRMEELAAENGNISYTIPYSASEYISESVQSAFQNIIQGVFLAAVVVFLFLRRGGSTLTICLSMPVCILIVFIMMNALGLTLNMLSLGGIAMGVGMIVDNSIVVLENITRFSAEGHDRMSACVDGTKEVTSSVIASTLTTEAVFIPLGMVNGQVGDMFRDFSLTIAALIAASLIISLTVVPLLCYFTLDEERVHKEQMKRQAKKAAGKEQNALTACVSGWVKKVNDLYLRLLHYFVYHLKAGILVSVGLVVVFVLTLTNTTMVLTPEMDQGQVSVSIEMPIGSSLEESSTIADRVAAIAMREVPELEDMYYQAQNESVTLGFNLVDKMTVTAAPSILGTICGKHSRTLLAARSP